MAPDHASELLNRKLTPMMQQYLAAKAVHPDAILFFRMGDFFEMFFEDAKVASAELDLTLTSRDKDRGEDAVPMAGVPHHAATSYIARLVERGHTVVVCDQIEDPRLAKGLVKRAITRVVTPGTLSDLEALDPVSHNYVGALAGAPEGDWSLAMLDMLAGELVVTRTTAATCTDEMRRMGVRELVLAASLDTPARAAIPEGLPLRTLPDWPSAATARAFLSERFGAALTLPEGGNDFDVTALAAVIGYVENTQRRALKQIMPPRAYRATDAVVLDEATRRNLEILTTQMENRRQGSLIWHLDRCRTAMGSRLLAQWLSFPLRDPYTIGLRQDSVAALKDHRELRASMQAELDAVRDLERVLGRLAIGRATPYALGLIRNALGVVPQLQTLGASVGGPLGQKWQGADSVAELAATLKTALVEAPPISPSDGGIFQRGYQADLDELIGLATEGHGFLVELEQRERARTGINNLKVRYNRVFGYYIEVTRSNLQQVPADYVRKQTLVGAERFITDELKRYEDKVLHADEARKHRELELFEALCVELGSHTPRLRALSRLLAETDVLLSLAHVADEGRYIRPTLTSAPVLTLVGSRHPVIERLMPQGERFVPNDISIDVDTRQLAIITGPNMAGKSTVMRQVALTTLLAHVGAFVPAKEATLGLCDRIFTRVGAADNLGKGRSTFMVEMMETATILKDATRTSLVLLDEIGRGTSTFDGVSIAWAVAEYLHDKIGCRTLFATHYHELTDLARERPRIVNLSVAVQEHHEKIVFLRKLVEGPANRSYGIQVARLAGLPEIVLTRARQILANLEAGELDEEGMPFIASSHHGKTQHAQLQLFHHPAAPPHVVSAVEMALQELDPLNLTPMQALAELARLKLLLPS